MQLLNKIYIRMYFLIFALYAFMNKGVAYTYLVEALLAAGILLLFLERKKIELLVDKKVVIVLLFIILTTIYIFFGILNFSIADTIRDSLVFEYAGFAFILYFFKDEADFIWDKLILIYKWIPLVILLNFFIANFFTSLQSISLFGNIPLLLYKNGDKSVHLLVSTLLLFLFTDRYSKRWLLINTFLILLDMLILLSYTRSGSVAYFIGLICFFLFNRGTIVHPTLKSIIKWAPLLLIVIIGIFASIQIQADDQGRVVGFSQIKDNLSSIVDSDIDGNLGANKVWRLIWWAKIVNESFSPKYFLTGKGLGMSLAGADQQSTDENVRSPHNYHLTIMARYGIIIFSVWLYWLWLLFKPLFSRKLVGKSLVLTCILLAFIINASFDVYLEGPMGAFPFWTFVGLLFIMEDQNLSQEHS